MPKSNAHLSNQKIITKTFESPTGAKLAGFHIQASGQAKGVVHILHGMSEHAGRYVRFAKVLSANGYHVYAHDQRGHGNTIAPDASPGLFAKRDGLAKVIADIEHINAHITKTHPKLPITLLGHSMGSILAQSYLMENSNHVSAAILMNGSAQSGFQVSLFKFLIKIATAFKGSDVPSLLADQIVFNEWNEHFAPNRTKSDWLSSDESEVDAFVNDPLCGAPVTNSLMRDTTIAMQKTTDIKHLQKIRTNLPIFIIGGEQDPSTNFAKQLIAFNSRLKALDFENVKLSIYANSRHEGLNDVEQKEITSDIINWLNENT
ncbi:MAG: lysophospholipase [Nitratireductor sp.]